MSTDLEKLVVQMSADFKAYERELQKANGVTARQAAAIEKRFWSMNKKLDGLGKAAAASLVAPLSGIAAALSVREVLQYADAWTKAKNSLAVAGLTGARQADVLDQLFESAQRNSTPIAALTDLYGKAAQAGDNLGATQDELIRFSDGVSVALKAAGTSAGAASGALTQLGQLLGSARVQAEEFNSVNEGARPILIAVANGLDRAGGSVNKLKQLVNDGEVSGREFFRAFLKGLPSVQAMAANATQTIEQGVTKVNNAFTRYIGETDASLGATQRLVQGLNALADNFETTADTALKLAGIIAAALVGRSIAGMVASLGLAVTVLGRFLVALRAAATLGGLAAAIGGLGAAAGPIGATIAAVTAALYLFSDRETKAEEQTRKVNAVLKELGILAPDAAKGVDALGRSLDEQAKKADNLRAKLELLRKERERQETPSDSSSYVYTSGNDIEDLLTRLGLVSRTMDEISEKAPKEAVDTLIALGREAQKSGSDAEDILRRMNAIGDVTGMDKPVLALVDALKKAVSYLAAVRLGEAKLAAQVAALDDPTQADRETSRGYARSPRAAFARNAPLPPTKPDDISYAYMTGTPLNPKRGGGKKEVDDYQQATKALQERTKALEAETAAQAGLNPLVNDYGFAIEKARAAHELLHAAEEAGIAITPELKAKIDDLATGYANASVAAQQLAEKQDKIRESAAEALGTAKDFAQGFVSDMMNGVSAAEALGNALYRLADKLLDMAFTSLFDPKGGFGTLLSGLFAGFAAGGPVKAATGGSIRGRGTGTSDSIPAMLSNGEFVVNAKQARKYRALLEQINGGGVAKMAAGGFVGMPRMPVAAPRSGGALTVAPVYNIQGSPNMSPAELRRILADNNKALLQTVKKSTYGWYEDHKYRFAG